MHRSCKGREQLKLKADLSHASLRSGVQQVQHGLQICGGNAQSIAEIQHRSLGLALLRERKHKEIGPDIKRSPDFTSSGYSRGKRTCNVKAILLFSGSLGWGTTRIWPRWFELGDRSQEDPNRQKDSRSRSHRTKNRCIYI